MLRLVTLMLMIAAPAWAHEGTHLHPHGAEGFWAAILAAGLVIAAVWAFGRYRGPK